MKNIYKMKTPPGEKVSGNIKTYLFFDKINKTLKCNSTDAPL